MKFKETLGPAFFAAIGAFLMMNWWYNYFNTSNFTALIWGIEVAILLYLLMAYAKDMEMRLVET